MTARFTVMMALLTMTLVFLKHFCKSLQDLVFICFCVFCAKAKHGYRNLTGIDYSSASVELAKNILQAEDLTDVSVKVSNIIVCH